MADRQGGDGSTPLDAVRDGIIIDKEATASALRELLKSSEMGQATAAVAAIAGAAVIVRHAKMPKMTESALRRSVRYEAGKYISASVEDSCIEFEILGPAPGEDDKMNVMLVAAPNETINSHLETLELAGLEPVSVDIEAFAIQRALIEMSDTRPGENTTIAILDIGAVSTDVNIVAHEHFALTRHIPIAGNHFTSALMTAQKMGWEDAEMLKQQVNMRSLLSADGDPAEQALARVVQTVLDELLREVRRSINYYYSQVTEGSLVIPDVPEPSPVSKLVITGGSALLKGIDDYMAARLGTTVEAWNIFDNPRFQTADHTDQFKAENHPLLAMCISLAVKADAQPGGQTQQEEILNATSKLPRRIRSDHDVTSGEMRRFLPELAQEEKVPCPQLI